MTKTAYNPWELSFANESKSAADRHEVARLLEQWGCTSTGSWPNRAAITGVEHELTQLGLHVPGLIAAGASMIQHGMTQTPINQALASAGFETTFEMHNYYVFFRLAHAGTAHYNNPASLTAYLMAQGRADLFVGVISLGCGHDSRQVERAANQYREYRCNDCGYKWSVDSSG
jgi:hypothetical protein